MKWPSYCFLKDFERNTAKTPNTCENLDFFFQTNNSATIQTNGETKTTLESRETKTSLIPATFDHKFEPQVLFTVTKENQVTIVINQREIHQHAEIVKSEMV